MPRESAHPLTLLLAYEELERPERQRVDRHLSSCDACRLLLERLQRVERECVPLGELPLPAEAEDLALAADPRARASLEAVLEATTAGANARRAPLRLRATGAHRAPARPWSLILRWGSVAAAAAFAIVFLQPPLPPAPARSVSIGPSEPLRSPNHAQWHTGDSFVLELELDRPGTPVVFALGPDAKLTLLHPAAPDSPLALLPAGRHRLPAAGTGRDWRFVDPPGRETFFVVVLSTRAVPLKRVLDEIAWAPPATSREHTLARVRTLLARRLGAVTEIEVDQQP